VQVGKGIPHDTLQEMSPSVSIAVGLASRRLGDNR
jgi:hypothetical protein